MTRMTGIQVNREELEAKQVVLLAPTILLDWNYLFKGGALIYKVGGMFAGE